VAASLQDVMLRVGDSSGLGERVSRGVQDRPERDGGGVTERAGRSVAFEGC
jgi:hypothetical protein